MYKLQLNSDGSFLNKGEIDVLRHKVKSKIKASYPMLKLFGLKMTGDKVSDCYGAELYKSQKCLTCEDVLWAYQQRE